MHTRKQLRQLKAEPKQLEIASFGPIPKGLPQPLHRLKGGKLKVCGPVDVGADCLAFFIWKSAPELQGRALYGYLFRPRPHGLEPLARLDYHLSHKNLHIIVNCEDERDLTGRNLSACKEFDLKEVKLDPDSELDRKHFIHLFCKYVGIALGRRDFLT